MERLTPYEVIVRLQHRHITCVVPVRMKKGVYKGLWRCFFNMAARYRVVLVHPESRRPLAFERQEDLLAMWSEIQARAAQWPVQAEVPPFLVRPGSMRGVRSRWVCAWRAQDRFSDDVWQAWKQARPAWLDHV